MSGLSSKVASARADLLATKSAVISPLELAKQTITSPTPTELASPHVSKWEAAPVVATDEHGISKHADGTYSFIDAKGEQHIGMTEEEARTTQAYSAASLKAVHEGAPRDFLGDALNRLGQGTVNLVEQGAKAFTGDQTLASAVQSHNLMESEERFQITQEHVDLFNSLKSSKGPLSLEQRAFKRHWAFNTLNALEEKVGRSNKRYESVEQTAKDTREYVPVNRTAEASAEAAWEVISENKGTGAALVDAVTNNLGAYVAQGIDSIPFMIAFTTGGPVTQMGVMGTLARGKAKDMEKDFIKEHNRQPSLEEQTGIEMWAAAATALEKFGDMAAVKAIPLAKFGRAKGIVESAANALPASVKNIAAKTSSSKLMQFVGKPLFGLAGEGVSGASTEVAEQFGVHGEIHNTNDIAKAGIAEALGTPGGIGGMVALNASYRAAAATAKGILNTPTGIKEPSIANDTLTVEETPEQPSQKEFDWDTATVDEKITATEQAIASITPEAEKADPIAAGIFTETESQELLDTVDNKEASTKELLLASKQLELLLRTSPSKEWRTKFLAAQEKLDARLVGDTTVRNSIDLDAFAASESIEEVLEDAPVNEAEAEFLTKAKEVRAAYKKTQTATKALKASERKSMAEVSEEVQSNTGKKKGFLGHLAAITDAIKTTEVRGALPRKLEALYGDMATHLGNQERKLAAFTAARKASQQSGNYHVIQGTKDDAGNMQYTLLEENSDISNDVALTDALDQFDGGEFTTIVHATASNKLIKNIEAEIDFGNKALELAKQYVDTGYAPDNASDVAQLESYKTKAQARIETKAPVAKQEIKSNPTKTEEVITEVATQPVKEERSVRPDPTDTDITWEGQTVTVDTPKGKRTVDAKTYWDRLQKEIKICDQLLRCMKG